MATVPVEKELLENLVFFKLKRIQALIQEILNRWNESSSTIFIEKVRTGIYENAENDAIELRQQLLEEKKLHDLVEKL